MREDDVQVPESELLDDSALEGITGGLASGGGRYRLGCRE
jgi:hypothetical protein